MYAHEEIEQHFVAFERLVAQAGSYSEQGRYDAAAAYAYIAAAYATANHAGIFVSPQLEEVLLSIGRKVANKVFSRERETLPDGTPCHVLHVLTEAAGIGGHTRMVWRWIQQDTQRRHSVVLTRQGFVRVPQALKEAIHDANGKLYLLNERIGNILTWSRQLRKIAASVDMVVLHTYTDDVIPLIAFADKRSIPPIVFLNQSDHKFWIGVGISSVIASQRHSGLRHAQVRRGIDESRCGLLPLTITPMPRTLSRSEAKRRIGLPEDSLLLLSIARPSKYKPLSGYGSRVNELVLPESVLPVLQKYPKVFLLVIGPEQGDRWERASETVQGRIKALGRRQDTMIFYQAADIYLDSFPFTSMSSLSEAANYGLPLVCCYPYSDVSDILCADTPALVDTVLRARNISEYISAVSHLIEDATDRARLGEITQQRVLAVHSGDHWKQVLRDLYLQAGRVPSAITVYSKEDQKTISELDLLSLSVDRNKVGVDQLTQAHLRLLPVDLRLKLWVQMLREYHSFVPSLLLPEWLGMRVIRALAGVRYGGI